MQTLKYLFGYTTCVGTYLAFTNHVLYAFKVLGSSLLPIVYKPTDSPSGYLPG